MAGKSYIDCWPIYARHVVCVKFPFGTLPPRRMLLLVAQWQDPFSLQLQLQPRLHFIIFSRAHTPEHTSAHSTHTLLFFAPYLQPFHGTLTRRCLAWLRLAALSYSSLRLATPSESCLPRVWLVCVCVHSVTCAEVSLLCAFPQDALAWKSKRAPFVCCIRRLPGLDVCAQQRQTWQHQQQQQPNSCFGLF